MYNGNMEWRVVLEQDKKTGDWAIWCPELPGCVSAGQTPSEQNRTSRKRFASICSRRR